MEYLTERLPAYVSPRAELAADVELDPGAVVHADAVIGAGTRVGAAAVIHEGTHVGGDCLIEDGAVLGKRPRLRKGSSAAGAKLESLVVGEGSTICCLAVVYAGARLGSGVIIGDHAQIRELAQVGDRTVVGRGSTVDYAARLGFGVLIQTGVYLCGGTVVEDDVFLGPGVVTTNDSAMGRHAAGEPLVPPTFRRASRIGGGVVLVPGVEVGEEAYVAAGALVTRDVGAREAVLGLPARNWRPVEDEELFERWP